jgi:hypothetical protein
MHAVPWGILVDNGRVDLGQLRNSNPIESWLEQLGSNPFLSAKNPVLTFFFPEF